MATLRRGFVRLNEIKKTNGGIGFSENNKNIEDSLSMIISTKKGTRAGMPDYGNNVVDLVFDPNDDFLRLVVEDDLLDAITMYEPRVLVSGIDFYLNDDGYGVVLDIRYETILISEKYMIDEII